MPKGSRWHQEQISRYSHERSHYETYAEVLREALRNACRRHAPLAIVEARAKTLSSFAEKALRKADKYDEPARQFTDLCGARVITSTRDEADRLCEFIRAHFKLDEANSQDVRTRLKATEFGYLSVHYIVQMRDDNPLGIDERKLREIGSRKGELQVRTLLQHAWADVIHDRIYKSEFQVPPHFVRDSARFAALLEDIDDGFMRLVEGLEAYHLNFGGHMTQEQVRGEIATLTAILENEPDPDNKPALALRIGRLSRSIDDSALTIATLSPYADAAGLQRAGLLVELGAALCLQHRHAPNGARHRQGRSYLREVARPDDGVDGGVDKLRAQALFLLAHSHREEEGESVLVRELQRLAYESNPDDPYYLIMFVESEIAGRGDSSFLSVMRPALRKAIATCREHAEVGLMLPWAFFTLAKLHLLLDEADAALRALARAVEMSISDRVAVPHSVFESQLRSLARIDADGKSSLPRQWARRLLTLAEVSKLQSDGSVGQQASAAALRHNARRRSFTSPILIIAGGADPSLQAELRDHRDDLLHALRGLKGTVICGGTKSGIPGVVADVTESLRRERSASFELIGYTPPASRTAEPDRRYDALVKSASKATMLAALQYWTDLVAAGIRPADVKLLGINGGETCAFEYRMALALGATAGIVESSGRAATEIFHDPDWSQTPNLVSLPAGPMTMHAFVCPGHPHLRGAELEQAARAVHGKFLEDNKHKHPDPAMVPWEALREDLKSSNRRQAEYAEQILRSVGYGVRPVTAVPALPSFTAEEVEEMAEMEHGRWNVERAMQGWRFRPERDVARKLSPYLTTWKELPDRIRDYDRKAVRDLPQVLSQAGLEVYRLAAATRATKAGRKEPARKPRR